MAFAVSGMVKKKKKVSSCFEYKENTSVTKPQRYDFKQKKTKKDYIEATQVTLKFIS